ncbi:MAG: mechanosensitive ion channel domain-containing protein [Planctomycetota bacterium]
MIEAMLTATLFRRLIGRPVALALLACLTAVCAPAPASAQEPTDAHRLGLPGEDQPDAETGASAEDAVAPKPRPTSTPDPEDSNPFSESLREVVPDELHDSLLGLEYWQWLGLLAVIVLAYAVELVVRGVVAVRVERLVRKLSGAQESPPLARPAGLAAAGLTATLLLPLLGLVSEAQVVLHSAAKAFTILACTWTAWRLVDLGGAVLADRASRTSTRFDDVLVPMLRKAVKTFVVAIGLIYAAQALQFNIVPLITGLGIGGLAFAFAAKDTIENFFGSVAVILDKPFEVGDWVVINDIEGTVEHLGFRSTRVRTFYNSQVTVPNSNLVRANIDNMGRRVYRRWKTHIGLQYDTPPEKLVAFTEGIREFVRTHPYTRKDYYQVWMHQWSASSMDVLLYVFFEVPDWNTELRERERLFVDIVRLADRLGVQFAYPTRTVHLYQEEHKPHESRHEPPTSMTDRRAMVSGIRAAQQVVADQAWMDEKPGPQTYGEVGLTPLDDAGNDTLGDDSAVGDAVPPPSGSRTDTSAHHPGRQPDSGGS